MRPQGLLKSKGFTAPCYRTQAKYVPRAHTRCVATHAFKDNDTQALEGGRPRRLNRRMPNRFRDFIPPNLLRPHPQRVPRSPSLRTGSMSTNYPAKTSLSSSRIRDDFQVLSTCVSARNHALRRCLTRFDAEAGLILRGQTVSDDTSSHGSSDEQIHPHGIQGTRWARRTKKMLANPQLQSVRFESVDGNAGYLTLSQRAGALVDEALRWRAESGYWKPR
jgi:hypothetical protein